jgi:enoyl-CoA hydratase/carnithine racemase
MSPENFNLSIADGVAHLVLNRPLKRNAKGPSFWAESPATARLLDAESAARSSFHQPARTSAAASMCRCSAACA